MSEPKIEYGIHCNQCQYEGHPRTNSSNIFLIFFLLLCSSIFFLPMIIVALVYMAVAITRPAIKSCPECKSTDIIDLELESIKTPITSNENVAKSTKNP